jgi:hypothetical protein
MTDPNGLDLVALAPEVDPAASRALFDRRRARSRRRRRLGAGLAAAAVLAVGGAALAAGPWPDDRDTTVASGPSGDGPADGEDIGFEVVRVAEGSDRMGMLRSATTGPELDRLWSDAGLPGAPLAADFFDRWLVVSITIPDDACPPELTRFEVRDGTLTPVFSEVARECDEPLIPKTFVVAIERAAVAPQFTLRLPADDVYGFAEQRLLVDVPQQTATTTTAAADGTADPAPSPDEAPPAVDAFTQFAKSPSAETAEAVPFAPTVDIGLGPELLAELDASARLDPAAWRLELAGRWGGAGTTSALELLAGGDPIEAVRDRRRSCAGSFAPPVPPGYEAHTLWSLEPSDVDSCLSWFAVDLYLDGDGDIAAVTVELWEP